MVLIDLQFFRREVSWGLGWLSASYTWVGSIHYSGIPVMGIAAAKKNPEVVTLLLLPVPFLVLVLGLLMALD